MMFAMSDGRRSLPQKTQQLRRRQRLQRSPQGIQWWIWVSALFGGKLLWRVSKMCSYSATGWAISTELALTGGKAHTCAPMAGCQLERRGHMRSVVALPSPQYMQRAPDSRELAVVVRVWATCAGATTG